MILFLPFPPTVNTYWRTVRVPAGRSREMVTRVLISERGRQYREAVQKEVLAQLPLPIHPLQGGVRVHLWACPPDRRRRDLDNLPKAVFDACTHSRVWGDDSQIQRLTIEWATMAVPDNGPAVQGVAFPIKPGSICLHISPLP